MKEPIYNGAYYKKIGNVNFRPFNFSDKDYQAWLTIENAAHPEHPQSIEQADT